MDASQTIGPRRASSESTSRHSAVASTKIAENNRAGPPFQASFFGKESAAARGVFFKIFGGGVMMISLCIFLMFSIYWGALWRTPSNVHKLNGYIVDFDGGEIGTTVSNVFRGISDPHSLTWHVKPASDFPGGPADVARVIHNEEAWAAVVINAAATSNLMNAASSASTTYNASGAITIYASEARNENAYRSFIRPTTESVLQQIALQFAAQFTTRMAGQSNFNTIATTSPNILVQPVSHTLVNIAPFDVPVGTAITFVGMIYLLILSFIVTMVLLGARETSGFARSLKTSSLIGLRLGMPLIAYFWLSLMFSLLSLAFQVPFGRHFGKGGFVIYWMLSWFAMAALGLALEFALTLLTPRFTPFFLILWVISNVSVALFPIDLYPRVFKYGYAAPFYAVSTGVRAILFGTKNHLGMNFGILAAWAAISLITVSAAVWLLRRKETNAWKRERNSSEKF